MRTKEEIAREFRERSDKSNVPLYTVIDLFAAEIERLEKEIEGLKNPGKGYRAEQMKTCSFCNTDNYMANRECYQCKAPLPL